MKKVLLCILSLFNVCAISAQTLSNVQKQVKQEIYNAIKKVGTNLQDDGGEVIRFTSGEINYIVQISADDKDPMYVTIGAYFNLPESYKEDIARRAALNAAGGMPVFCDCRDNVLVFDCEMYLKESKPFTSVLPSMIKAIKASVEGFNGEYEKLNQTNSSTPSSTSNGTFGKADTYIFPHHSTASDKKLFVSKVYWEGENTVLEFISYNGGQYQWCSMNKNAYIMANGKKYSLKRAEGIAYSPSHTDYPNYQSANNVSLTFKLYFPEIPKTTKTLDFYESSTEGWIVNNITLDNNGIQNISGGETIVTSDHKWRATGIQILPTQTVIKKVVAPTTKGTYVNSSQDEYIQDADTGRKYYLQNSSIGFEGNRTIVQDNKDHEFFEVYPALPSSVKRINISSGSQYYVKNLQIR